jgi:hypothetical protein
MTLLYNGNIRNLFMGRGILAAFSSPCAITVYSGAQPTAAAVTAGWTSYNQPNANYLAHYIGAAWTQPSGGILLQLTIPPAVVVEKSGTATWAILWTTNVTYAATQGSTLPSTSFMVVSVSDSVGAGVIRFANPTLSAGISTAILDGSMGAYVTP